MTLSGCDISSKHLKMEYGENDNEDIVGWDDVDEGNITDWENASVQRWSDVDEFSDWVYAQMVFDDITDEYPVRCLIIVQMVSILTAKKYIPWWVISLT